MNLNNYKWNLLNKYIFLLLLLKMSDDDDNIEEEEENPEEQEELSEGDEEDEEHAIEANVDLIGPGLRGVIRSKKQFKYLEYLASKGKIPKNKPVEELHKHHTNLSKLPNYIKKHKRTKIGDNIEEEITTTVDANDFNAYTRYLETGYFPISALNSDLSQERLDFIDSNYQDIAAHFNTEAEKIGPFASEKERKYLGAHGLLKHKKGIKSH